MAQGLRETGFWCVTYASGEHWTDFVERESVGRGGDVAERLSGRQTDVQRGQQVAGERLHAARTASYHDELRAARQGARS